MLKAPMDSVLIPMTNFLILNKEMFQRLLQSQADQHRVKRLNQTPRQVQQVYHLYTYGPEHPVSANNNYSTY